MAGRERRKHARIQRQFVTAILDLERDYQTEGVTENVSLGGAFIKTKDWRSFRIGDKAVLTLFLPPSLADREKTVGLRGEGVIRRIDRKNEGIALEFTEGFPDFEKIENLQIAGKSRYKKISYYLHSISELDLADLVRGNPLGFLVERSQHALDSDVVFRFQTVSLDEDHALQELELNFSVSSELEERVIEIKKRKLETAMNTITVGRASTNDIVIYNNTVSKAHAYLYLPSSENLEISQGPDKVCYLVDCGSKNGTSLNGRALEPFERYKVVDGDEILFGQQTRMVYFSTMAFVNLVNQLRASRSA